MARTLPSTSIPVESPPTRCYGCHRPEDLCYCDSIPRVANRTSIVILQHRRERFHPFNTARIVKLALQRCELLVDRNARLAQRFNDVQLSANTGLLFPDETAPVLTDLPANQRPDQLVVLDGTWHHAKTLMRDIPRLSELKRFRLAPTSPGQYRIRREPTEQALSTIEATVSALRSLEPDTQELDALLAVFDSMIDRQLSHPKSGWRKNERRRRGMPNVPRRLTGDLSNVVVAYGDQERVGSIGRPESSSRKPGPIFWTARRLVSGERFACAIDCPSLQETDFLDRLQLDPASVRNPASVTQFRQRWQDFIRPNDLLVVYQPGTAKLLENINADFLPVTLLKSISLDCELQKGTLGDFLATQGIASPAEGKSRASQRLADSIAYVEYLNQRFRHADDQ